MRDQNAFLIFEFLQKADNPNRLLNHRNLADEVPRNPDFQARLRVLSVNFGPRDFAETPLGVFNPDNRRKE